MRKSWLVCVLLGTIAWGQAAGTPPPAQAGQGQGQSGAPMPGMPQAPAAPPDTSASVPPEEPVITVKGVCPAKPAAAKGAAAAEKTPAADCKTVITKAEFEKLAAGVAPNMTPQLRRQLASVLPRLIAMSDAARKKGLDKTERFKETVKFAQMQILTNELNRQIQEEAAKVPAEDIAEYYKKNPEAFEQFNLDRLFVPRTKQLEADDKDKEDEDKDAKLSDEAKKAKEAADKAKADQGEQDMTKLADTLRARAAAGEDFVKLQKEAFDAAGMKIESPTVNLPKVRRTGLPPGHAAAFDLKAGEVSQVINDAGGHYIYKVISKDQLTQDQAKDEIHSTLQNQRTREMTDKVQKSFTVDTNEKYFGPPGANGNMPPPRRIPNPRVAPSPTTPQGQPPVPPPASQPN